MYAMCKHFNDEGAWKRIVTSVVNSPFMCPPTTDIYKNDPTLTPRIELSFYLTIVLDADYIKNANKQPGASIHLSPSHQNYPTKFNHNNNYTCNSRSPVGYHDTSSLITDRINEIAKSLSSRRIVSKELVKNPIAPTSKNSGNYFNQLMILRAEKMIKEIGVHSDLIFRGQRPITDASLILKVA